MTALVKPVKLVKLLQRQTLHIWIAMLAILFSAVAPTISHAVAAAYPGAALPMCSADGGKAPAGLQHGMEHCAFCTIHGGGDALPPPAAALAPPAGRAVYPSLFYSAPRGLHAWSAANPRAPPFPA